MQDCAVDEAACAEWAKDMGNADRLWTLTNEILGESF